MIDETNNSLDSLPFNPAKMLTASLNIANSARLHTSGVAKLGIGIAADGLLYCLQWAMFLWHGGVEYQISNCFI